MILQALKEYYDRMAAYGGDDAIAPQGWEKKEIAFLIVIDEQGNLVNVEDTREKVGKKLIAHTYLVPLTTRHSSEIAANFLWDKVEYVLAYKQPSDEKTPLRHEAFIKRLQDYTGIKAIDCIIAFFNADGYQVLKKLPIWDDIKKSTGNISFKIAGHKQPVFREPEIIAIVDTLNKIGDAGDDSGICLITGKKDKIARLHTAIKGVRGAQTAGANIVSFNVDSARSYGKNQGSNAPTGESAVFAYTTALNTLLGKDSKQKIQVGDATTVFWSERKNTLEENLPSFFSEPTADNPNTLTDNVKNLYQSVESGAYSTPDQKDIRFYILGLSPNAARISIRFWHMDTLDETAKRFKQYFEDLSICHADQEMDHLPIRVLLESTVREKEDKKSDKIPPNLAANSKTKQEFKADKKSDKIPPNLAGNMMRSILEDLPFPESLLRIILLLFKADHKISYARVKLLKAFINRKLRINNPSNERSITMSLDTENNNIGYLLGRLFAVLEKIQLEASPGLNSTIKDRYYAAASSTPISVFGKLMRMKNYHIEKLENQGRKIWFEQLLGEIISKFSTFPATLSLEDQGRFAIGYYHQNRDFYTSKTEK